MSDESYGPKPACYAIMSARVNVSYRGYSPMLITAVLLDVDETLVMERVSNEAAVLATCERGGQRESSVVAA